jgi:alkylation response protein AidB-like acyl-CoA dehydrogenase
MTSGDRLHDEALASVQPLLPVLAAAEAAAAASREVPAENVALLQRAGLPRLLQPRRFGGMQGSFRTFSCVVETLAGACAATAWVYAVLAEHQWIIGCFPEQAQIDVWEDNPLAVASSSLAPRNVAQAANGGYVLNGDFPFSSGSGHASWAILGAQADAARYFLVPMDELRRIDDWQVLGLRGTGSQTLRAEDVFVPAHRSVLLANLQSGNTPGAAVHVDYPLLRAPRDYLTPFSLPPVAFALARRAQALVVPAVRARQARALPPPLGTETAQMAIAEAEAELDAAHLLLDTRRAEACARVDAGQPITTEVVLRLRRDIGFAQRLIRSGVERLVGELGSHIVYDSSPLQAILRDVLTIATHRVWSWPRAMLPYGEWRLSAE